MNCYSVKELKEIFFEYFIKECGHQRISGSSLVPEVDNSVLFTPAGMHPLIPYLTGKYKHPNGDKLVNIQEVVRTGAIDKVGDSSFLTFFELFGAWIIGDYTRYDTLLKVWNFFTSKEYLDIPSEQIYITYFGGNDKFSLDEETLKMWKQIGVEDDHLCPTEKNWKGPYANNLICGPNTRIFYDTKRPRCSSNCNVLCNCGKYVELWDVVFMDYLLKDNVLEKSNNGCVDMGAGIERIATLVQGVDTIYETDMLNKIVQEVSEIDCYDISCIEEDIVRKRRIVADHLRCACFVLGDKVTTIPSNKSRGYVLRKVIRRAINNAEQLGIGPESYYVIVNKIIDLYKDEYPLLNEKREFIINQLSIEYEIYKLNISKNMLQVEKYLNSRESISANEIKNLFDRYGVPMYLIEGLISKKKRLVKE